MWVKILIIPVLLLLSAADFSHAQSDYRYTPASRDPSKLSTVIGRVREHTVKAGETLLDIARQYGLAISALQSVYPDMDPWLLEEGSKLEVPTLWIVPASKHRAIVVNVPETRLYRFHAKSGSTQLHATQFLLAALGV